MSPDFVGVVAPISARENARAIRAETGARFEKMDDEFKAVRVEMAELGRRMARVEGAVDRRLRRVAEPAATG